MTIGIVSGYFNPLHYGHIEYFNAAKDNCSMLIAIINSDYQRVLKGSKYFMDERHRELIVSNIKSIDTTIISIDKDKTQCETLKYIRKTYPHDELIFMNSGDRKTGNQDVSELIVCKKLKILDMFLDYDKLYSSSELVKL